MDNETKEFYEDWEQGRREPSGATKALLRIAEQHPEALRDLAA
jgi:putative transcriptional regulator